MLLFINVNVGHKQKNNDEKDDQIEEERGTRVLYCTTGNELNVYGGICGRRRRRRRRRRCCYSCCCCGCGCWQ
jgi:hypothetical protein